MAKLSLLNLGCGTTFHKDWTNIDFISTSPLVRKHNLLKGIPFEKNSFDCVYHSHVLEHFTSDFAQTFIKECYRVLKEGGIIRVAIPDLEQIAKNYLKYLNEAEAKVPGSDEKYNWTLLEMYDQTVRTKSGGKMAEYIKDKSKNNDAFLLERNGKESEGLIKTLRSDSTLQNSDSEASTKSSVKLSSLKDKILKYFLKNTYNSYAVGLFRSQGEIHQWMYDRYSLKVLLQNSGFKNVKVQTAFTSNLPDWKEYNLDGENGIPRKPDSLYMEAVK